MKEISRKKFLKGVGAVGVCAVVAPSLAAPVKQVKNGVWQDREHGVGADYQDFTARDVIFTQCQQCNAVCTIQAYVVPAPEGSSCPSYVRKLSGSQYSPVGMVPHGHIPYDTPLEEAVSGTDNFAHDSFSFRGAKICLKGQAGIQTAYDTHRVMTPLKRVGERGSGQWKSISWEQAYQEILDGDQELNTPGLREIWAYVPKEQVMEDWDKLKNGLMSKEAFDDKYKDTLIDTNHPDLGPKSNQIAFLLGHRLDFIRRLTANSFATLNDYDHAGFCGINAVIANIRSHSTTRMKKRMYPDYDQADLVIVWGTNPLTANRGPTTFAPRITEAIKRGMKLIVVDPRYSKTAEKAHTWVPVKPGGDGALALGMCRWILDNQRYDKDYLTLVNKEAAAAAGEPTWSDACYLVDLSDEKRPFLRPSQAGIEGEDTDFVVLSNGRPVPASSVERGDLDVGGTVNGKNVKTVFRLFKEKVFEKSMEEYASVSGIEVSQIEDVARQFTSYGKKVGIHAFRGAAMHTNGYYSTRAINILNHLVGNHDWMGGDTYSGAGFNEKGAVYDIASVPNANPAWGIPITRQKAAYEQTSFFETDGYPAKRPWYPMGNELIHEALPSSAEGYPYRLRAIFMSRTSPVISGPRSQLQAELLKDAKTAELVISSDIVIGESTKYADYVLPDLSYLESWNNETSDPILKHKFSTLYQPVTRVVPEARQTEQVLIDLGKEMGLPGVGKGAFKDGSSLDRLEEYYIKRVVNIAFDGDPVPDASPEELSIFTDVRKKALGQFYDEELLKSAIRPGEWAKAVTVLNRGGRFEAVGQEYQDGKLKYRFADLVHLYDDKAASVRNSYSGKFFEGVPVVEEIKKYDGSVYQSDRPFTFINWKSRNIATHRTISNAWLREIRSENYIWINPADAMEYGIETGNRIRVKSGSAQIEGTALVTSGIRPGVIGSNYNFGHFAYGAQSEQIDGAVIPAAASYGTGWSDNNSPLKEEAGFAKGRDGGFCVNCLAEEDDTYFAGYLADPIAGGTGQQDVYVEIERIS